MQATDFPQIPHGSYRLKIPIQIWELIVSNVPKNANQN